MGRGVLMRDNVKMYGDFENNQFKSGKIEWPDGKKYRGDWQDGQMSGKGIFEWADKKQFYNGMWKEGKPHGHGRFKNQKGDIIIGRWEKGCLVQTESHTN